MGNYLNEKTHIRKYKEGDGVEKKPGTFNEDGTYNLPRPKLDQGMSGYDPLMGLFVESAVLGKPLTWLGGKLLKGGKHLLNKIRPEETTRLYRAQGTGATFNASNAANGEALREFAGMWFTPNKDKPAMYAANALKGKHKSPSAELQYVDIPKSKLANYDAFKNPKTKGFDMEIGEDFLIPLDVPRKTIGLDWLPRELEMIKHVGKVIENLPK